MSTDQDEGLWTADDVAKYLRKHKQTVYRMCGDNLLPFSRVGGEYRFQPAAIRAWVTAKQQPVVR